MKLLISGGHPSPAIAVIDTLRQSHPTIEIVFIGRVIAQHTTGQTAGEQEAMRERGIPFYAISTAKWGNTVWQKFTAIGSVLWATLLAYQLLGQLKPDAFLSFGSYVAVPLALACTLRGIPVITHEQTRVAGISNQVISHWAAKVAISYPESAQFFPVKKTVLTGLPLRPQLFKTPSSPPAWASPAFLQSDLPILYVSGGSTGSHRINELIMDLLPELLTSWRIVHPCGRAHNHHDWQARLLETRQLLPEQLQSRYVVLEQVSSIDLAWLYRQPTVVFGRAGANTTAEVETFDLPAIFVPLPLSNYDEQHKNAQALVKKGQAVLIEQDRLDQKSFTTTLEQAAVKVAQTDRQQPVITVSQAAESLIEVVLNTLH